MSRESDQAGSPRDSLLKKLAKTGLTALGITVATAPGLAALNQAAQNASPEHSTPASPQEDPFNQQPPPGVTFPEGIRGDSSAPPVFKVYLPNVTNKHQEAPLRLLREFGNLEQDKVLFINRGEKAWVEMGDEELYQNLLKIRNEYSFHPNLKRRIYFYETYEQLRDTSGVPYDYPNNATLYPWGGFVRQIPIFDENDQFTGLRDYPPTFKDGEIRWQTAPDGAIEFHISLPEPLPGVLPAPEQITYLNVIGFDKGLPLIRFFFSGPEGPYKGMLDKYPPAERKKYPLITMLSPLRDYNFLFPVKLVYKQPPSK